MSQNLDSGSSPAFLINIAFRSPFNIQRRIDLVFSLSRIRYRIYPLSVPSPIRRRRAVFHREKRVAADNPLLPCLILIAFTGSRLDQYTPPTFCHRSSLLLRSALRI